jgi:hypothetical protein
MKELDTNRVPENVLVRWQDDYGNSKIGLDPSTVSNAFARVHSDLATHEQHINFLHRKLRDLRDIENFMQWIDQVHPELKRDYVVSQRVASRIEGPDYGAVCEAG